MKHIVHRHGHEFAPHGIGPKQLPEAIAKAVETGRFVGFQGNRSGGRPVFEYDFNGSTHRMAVQIGSNGFIVGANPASMSKTYRQD